MEDEQENGIRARKETANSGFYNKACDTINQLRNNKLKFNILIFSIILVIKNI